VLAGLIFYAVFKNHSEQQQAKAFVASLIAQDYQGAYRMWGCTDANPCRDYPFNRFMDDWGPRARMRTNLRAHRAIAILRLRRGDSPRLQKRSTTGSSLGGTQDEANQLRALAGVSGRTCT